MKKKIFAIVMSVLLVFSIASIASAKGYKDTMNSPYKKAVTELTNLGLVNGFSTDTFGTNESLTRAQLCTIVVRAMVAERDIRVYNEYQWIDVPISSWYRKYIDTAYKYDLMHGLGNFEFKPDEEITYHELLTVILNMLGYNMTELSGDWKINAERLGEKHNLLDGIYAYNLDGACPRGEAAQIIYNGLDEKVVSFDGFSYGVGYKTLRSKLVNSGVRNYSEHYNVVEAEVVDEDTVRVGRHKYTIDWDSVDFYYDGKVRTNHTLFDYAETVYVEFDRFDNIVTIYYDEADVYDYHNTTSDNNHRYWRREERDKKDKTPTQETINGVIKSVLDINDNIFCVVLEDGKYFNLEKSQFDIATFMEGLSVEFTLEKGVIIQAHFLEEN